MKRLTKIFDDEVTPIQERGIFTALALAIIAIVLYFAIGGVA